MRGLDIMKRVLVIDGQGGKIGRGIIERLCGHDGIELTAVGTNSMATANMMKGMNGINAATGENSIVVASARADIIAGPIGIIIANAMLGEITERAACAVSSSQAVRVLIPMNRTKCDNIIAGVPDLSMTELLDSAAGAIIRLVNDHA